MKKRLLILALVAVLGTAAWFISRSASSELTLPGKVETNIYAHYSEVPGKILSIPIELGQTVKAGDVLVVIDDSQKRYALQQLEKTQTKKQALLSELNTAVEPEGIKQRQNNVSLSEIEHQNALSNLELAKRDFENAEVLLAGAAISPVEFDNLKHRLETAEAAVKATVVKLDNAKQQLALYQKGTPHEKIAAAKADIELTQVQIQQTQEDLGKYQITALHSGTIISKNFLPGDLVVGGYNLCDIASSDDRHVITYIPKEYLAQINYNQPVTLRSADKEYSGTISFIDVKSQYAPREMQTTANRDKESIKLKISITPEVPLKIGENVTVIIPK